jgi:hypothetical protein
MHGPIVSGFGFDEIENETWSILTASPSSSFDILRQAQDEESPKPSW